MVRQTRSDKPTIYWCQFLPLSLAPHIVIPNCQLGPASDLARWQLLPLLLGRIVCSRPPESSESAPIFQFATPAPGCNTLRLSSYPTSHVTLCNVPLQHYTVFCQGGVTVEMIIKSVESWRRISSLANPPVIHLVSQSVTICDYIFTLFIIWSKGISTLLIILYCDVSLSSNLMWSPAQSNFIDKILRSKTWNSKSSLVHHTQIIVG